MSETDPLSPGVVIAGKYRVDRVLGRGGMAVVFAATHLQLREPVAIKVLHPHIRHRAGTVERFLREARVAMRLRSEHVARVFDIGTTEEGSPFIVMELLAGGDFATLLHEQGPFPLAEAVDYLLQACQALAEAHATGVVHRDLKPANIFLCASVDGAPSVKVLDFGVSKLLLDDAATEVLAETVPSSDSLSGLRAANADRQEAHGGSPQGAPATLTHTRALVGSPMYMAPEQIRSARDVDARADVWALGVVLYELVSGARPFDGDTLDDLCARIVDRHAAPFRAPSGPMPELEAVLDVCLAKDPADRYQSVRAFAEAIVGFGTADASGSLERIVRIAEPRSAPLASRPPRGPVEPTLSSTPSSSARVATSPTARRAIVAGVVALAAVASGGAWAVRERTRARAVTTSAAASTRCTSSRACTKDRGAPSRCRDDGACVALASPDCVVRASAEAIDGDDTVWFGTMLPLKGPTFGRASARSVDLAREDFEQMMASFGAPSGAAHVPRFGVLECDDTKDAMRAARHLVEDVHVPAIIGFDSAATLIDVGGSLLVPNGVVAIASLTTSPLATRLPTVPGQPRLVWRTTYDSATSANAMALVVPEVLEPQVRTSHGELAAHAPMRVALVRTKSRGGSTFDGLLLTTLRFNGKSAANNGSDFRAIVLDESDASRVDAEVAAAVRALDAFAPHVTIVIVDDAARLMTALEGAWSHPAYRPRYLFMTNLDAPVLDWIGTSVDRRRRTFGIAPVASRPPNIRFALHYNETSPEKTTPALAPSESYDAFYLLAYATYALGDRPLTGSNLALAIPKLMPPGAPIDVGPAQIFDAYSALRRGERIDLNGAVGSLDFDPATGEEPVDQTVVCAAIDERGRAIDDVESGIVFVSAKNALEGALRCP